MNYIIFILTFNHVNDINRHYLHVGDVVGAHMKQLYINAVYKDHPLAALLFKRVWPFFKEQSKYPDVDVIVVWVTFEPRCWLANRDPWQLEQLLRRTFEGPKRNGRLDVLFNPVSNNKQFHHMELGLVWLPRLPPRKP